MEEKTKLVAFRIPAWMQDDIVGNPKNVSGRVKELMIKGRLYEQMQETKKENKIRNGTSGNCTFLHNPLLAGISGVS